MSSNTNESELTVEEKLNEIADAADTEPSAITGRIYRVLAEEAAGSDVELDVEDLAERIIDDVHADVFDDGEAGDESAEIEAPRTNQGGRHPLYDRLEAVDGPSRDLEEARLNATFGAPIPEGVDRAPVAGVSNHGVDPDESETSRTNEGEASVAGVSKYGRDPDEESQRTNADDEAPVAGVSNFDGDANEYRTNEEESAEERERRRKRLYLSGGRGVADF